MILRVMIMISQNKAAIIGVGGDDKGANPSELLCIIRVAIVIIVTIVPILVGTCDLESLVASGHKKI